MFCILYIVVCILHACYGQMCFGELRLADKTFEHSGRLEIYHGSAWGTICDDNFNNIDARVACRQLGYSSGISIGNSVNDGTGQIVLDDLQCIGYESRLIDCKHIGLFNHNCHHNEDVGVECYFQNNLTSGELRLVGIPNTGTGRLEIYYNESWKQIYNSGFDALDAAVACRQLNYSYGHVVSTNYACDKDNCNSSIGLTDISCNGTENDLLSCAHNGPMTIGCSQSPVRLHCYPSAVIRIFGGSVQNSGSLQVVHDGSWETICSRTWIVENTVVACRQLGYRSGISLNTTVFDCRNGQFLFEDLNCNGTENSLDDCSHVNKNVSMGYNPNDVNVVIFCFGSEENWSEWSTWHICSASCNGGVQYKSRMCNTSDDVCGDQCSGPSYESQICNSQYCPVNGSWGEWSVWSDCTDTCGGGNKTRTRSCDSPFPSYGGHSCSGRFMEYDSCRTNICPVDGNWASWSSWDVCSVTCGGGIQHRYRNCSNPVPSYGGEFCYGSSSESLPCANICCPVDGNWGMWNEWGICNVSCGGGFQQRKRRCDNPPPLFSGKSCNGSSLIRKECNSEECLVNGGWDEWSEWSDCTTTCGSGNKTRARSRNSPAPSHGGVFCFGQSKESDICRTNPCPVNGNWESWSTWDECSMTYGGGIQQRYRNCSYPTPSSGGEYCNGSSSESLSCANICCPVDGIWGMWNEWSVCNVSCGGGYQERKRQCDNPPPLFGGTTCNGSGLITMACNIEECLEHGL